MVKGGQDWQKEWFGLLPESKVVVLMMSKSFLESAACMKELEAAIKTEIPIIPVYLEKVNMYGHYLGESEQNIKDAHFFRANLTGNAIPPVDQGFFQTGDPDPKTFDKDHWERNMDTLAARIAEICGGLSPSGMPLHGAATVQRPLIKHADSLTEPLLQSCE
jgi:hypothetical protein